MQFTTCVVTTHRSPYTRRQLYRRIGDGITQHALQALGDRVRIRQCYRTINGGKQALPAGERQWRERVSHDPTLAERS